MPTFSFVENKNINSDALIENIAEFTLQRALVEFPRDQARLFAREAIENLYCSVDELHINGPIPSSRIKHITTILVKWVIHVAEGIPLATIASTPFFFWCKVSPFILDLITVMSRLHRLFRSYVKIMMDVTLRSNSNSDWQAFLSSEITYIFHLTNGLFAACPIRNYLYTQLSGYSAIYPR